MPALPVVFLLCFRGSPGLVHPIPGLLVEPKCEGIGLPVEPLEPGVGGC